VHDRADHRHLGTCQFRSSRLDIVDPQAEVGDTEPVGEGAVAGRGWGRRREARREGADDEDLLAQRQEDPQVAVDVVVADQFLRFEVVGVELGGPFGLGCVDVNVIERPDVHRRLHLCWT